MLGVQYRSVNFGAGKRSGLTIGPNWFGTELHFGTVGGRRCIFLSRTIHAPRVEVGGARGSATVERTWSKQGSSGQTLALAGPIFSTKALATIGVVPSLLDSESRHFRANSEE